MKGVFVGALAATALFLAVGGVMWWRSTAPSPVVDAGLARVEGLLKDKAGTDTKLDALTAEIARLRSEATRSREAAAGNIRQADQIIRENVALAARVAQLEDYWAAFTAPRNLPEAVTQLKTAAELIQAYRTELQAKDSEIGQLREAVTLLTSANTAQEIALAKSEAREELRKELMDRFTAELTGLRFDLEAERRQRARDRWLSLIPLVGAVLLLFGGGFGGGG